MKKGIILLIYLLLGSFIFSKEISLIIPNDNEEFFKAVIKGVSDGSKKEGMEYKTFLTEGSPIKELNIITEIAKKGDTIVIIIPSDSYAIGRSIRVLNKKKVPVITLDRRSINGKIASYIGSDNEMGGEEVAKLLLRVFGYDGVVVELEGKTETSTSQERSMGFNKEATNKLQVTRRANGSYDEYIAYKTIKRILKEESDIQGIFAHNDAEAIGALKAVDEEDRDVMIVGFDGSSRSMELVKKGKLLGTVKQDPYNMGYLGAIRAKNIIDKKPYPKETLLEVDLITAPGYK